MQGAKGKRGKDLPYKKIGEERNLSSNEKVLTCTDPTKPPKSKRTDTCRSESTGFDKEETKMEPLDRSTKLHLQKGEQQTQVSTHKLQLMNLHITLQNKSGKIFTD